MNIYILLYFLLFDICNTCWLPKEVAEWAIEDFNKHEQERNSKSIKGTDRRSSAPFITGDGFRTIANHICEDANRCRMYPEHVKDGDIIFVKTDFFDFFVKDVINRINGKFIVITHNGDLSAPDGQNDAPRIGMPKYIASNTLSREYGHKLISHHGQNLWWYNKTTQPRPAFSHCLPIGMENRQYAIGKNIHLYIEALQKFVINRPILSKEDVNKKPLLLIAFYPKSRVPDRTTVWNILGVTKTLHPFYNYTDLSHMQWLEAIGDHKFVLAPFGHGLDTHRISEILLMGGYPVIRRSTISSCYDDSDNIYPYHEINKKEGSSTFTTRTNTVVTRGSLPVVIVDRWEDVTKQRLDKEWERLSNISNNHWDWKRLFIYHWIDRIQSY